MTQLASPEGVDTAQILAALRQAVQGNLEKKRRLGHYAVLWRNGQPLLLGEDAPLSPATAGNSDCRQIFSPENK